MPRAPSFCTRLVSSSVGAEQTTRSLHHHSSVCTPSPDADTTRIARVQSRCTEGEWWPTVSGSLVTVRACTRLRIHAQHARILSARASINSHCWQVPPKRRLEWIRLSSDHDRVARLSSAAAPASTRTGSTNGGGTVCATVCSRVTRGSQLAAVVCV